MEHRYYYVAYYIMRVTRGMWRIGLKSTRITVARASIDYVYNIIIYASGHQT